MKKKTTGYLQHLIALILACSLVFCGCQSAGVSSQTSEETQENAVAKESASSEEGTGAEAAGEASGTEEAASEKPDKSFREFSDEIFADYMESSPLMLHFRVKHPENFGIEVPEPGFGSYTVKAFQKGREDDLELLEQVRAYKDADLTEEEAFTRRMIEDALEYGIVGKDMIYFYQPLVPGLGVQSQQPIVLSEYEFETTEDVEDYFVYLTEFEKYLDQIGEFEVERADHGYSLPDAILDRIDESLQDYLIRPDNSILTESFAERLENIPDLTDKEKMAYIEENRRILKESFIPAYTRLSETIQSLKGRRSEAGGLCIYPGGKEYYEYLVKKESGTDSDMAELKSRITDRLSRDLAGISDLTMANPDIYANLKLAPIYDASPERIMDKLAERMQEMYPPLESTDYTIKHVPKALETALNTAFYIIPAIDETDTNVIYINDSKVNGSNMLTTLAHEGFPGHMYQYSYLHSLNIPPIRYAFECEGFAEGWGMFAEVYSWLMGLGLDEDTASLMYYSDSAGYGLYALMDIYINYDGWDMERTCEFMRKTYGFTDDEAAKDIYYRCAEAPGNYVKYYTGYMEISDMYERYIVERGTRADSREFFEFLLGESTASFRIIKEDFEAWLFRLHLEP